MPTYQELVDLCESICRLDWIYGEATHSNQQIFQNAVNSKYPSLCVGFLNIIHPERLHIIGVPEVTFLNAIGREARLGLVDKLHEGKAIGLLVAKGIDLPHDMIDHIIEIDMPVFSSAAGAEDTLTSVRQCIIELAAPSCSMHGVFMEVYGMGVLLTGQSGIGKSELGLELLTRGHSLVADDVVDFRQKGPGSIEGSAPALLANLLEVRGIGLLDVKTIFGETSFRRKMRLDMILELKLFEQGELMERLPETELFTEVLGEQIRTMVVPVGGGRNLAVLVEAAVRTDILQRRGINTIQQFFDRQRQLMDEDE
ncbi:MAG: HPr(Ser) kinase/phosphatase [Burkholderiales bacterium]|nr:HPr(Ser) kinase/phosphatase [Burkholderiales bacterium]